MDEETKMRVNKMKEYANVGIRIIIGDKTLFMSKPLWEKQEKFRKTKSK